MKRAVEMVAGGDRLVAKRAARRYNSGAMGKSKNVGSSNARYISRGPAGEKMCSRCRTLRPLEAFKIDTSRFDGRGYECSTCRDSRRVAPGPSLRQRRAQSIVGLKRSSGCQQWLGNVHAGRCRACANADTRRRYATDPSFKERRRQRASARRRGVDPVPPDARAAILEEFGGSCAYCPAPATGWDHVVPVTKGGLTEPYNIVPACGPCNSSKRTQNLWAWLEKTGRTPHPQLLERLALYHASLFLPKGPDPFD